MTLCEQGKGPGQRRHDMCAAGAFKWDGPRGYAEIEKCEPAATNPDRVWYWREVAYRAAAQRLCCVELQHKIDPPFCHYLAWMHRPLAARCVP